MGASSTSPGTTATSGTGLDLNVMPSRVAKRKRSHYEIATLSAPDLVTAGIIPASDAEAYFSTFFSGCHRFVPVFDRAHDSMDSVRRRSPLLFSAICSIGCRVLSGADSHHSRLLAFHTQRVLNAAVLAPPSRAAGTASHSAPPSSLETVQALLVKACYASERSLLVAVAMRLAIELGLPEAHDNLSARAASRRGRAADGQSGRASSQPCYSDDDDEATLMRKTRTWLHVVILSHIMHVDAGELPTLRFRGAASRCRILLGGPYATDEDLHLLPQVELNAIRARIRASLAQLCSSSSSSSTNNNGTGTNSGWSSVVGDDETLMDAVRGARIDIDVWFSDWTGVLAPHLARLP